MNKLWTDEAWNDYILFPADIIMINNTKINTNHHCKTHLTFLQWWYIYRDS